MILYKDQNQRGKQYRLEFLNLSLTTARGKYLHIFCLAACLPPFLPSFSIPSSFLLSCLLSFSPASFPPLLSNFLPYFLSYLWKRNKFLISHMRVGLSDGSVGKESTCNIGDPSSVPGFGRSPFNPWIWKIPWRRERLPTLVFWPGEFHGLYSPWCRKVLDTTEQISLQSSNRESRKM